MIRSIVAASLRFRFIVVAISAAMLLLGIRQIPTPLAMDVNLWARDLGKGQRYIVLKQFSLRGAEGMQTSKRPFILPVILEI